MLAEIEVSQRWALRQQVCKAFCILSIDVIRPTRQL
jgi:hypothetical protein